MDILIITNRADLWQGLTPVMAARGAAVRTSASMPEGQDALRTQKAALAVIDLGLDNAALRTAVFNILSIDAMTHTVSVSAMTEEEFHDAMEGLGMLMNLPLQPAAADIERMMDALIKVGV